MIDFFLQSLIEITDLHTLALIIIGVLFGIIGGSIPGFTITMAILVAFPFTFAMQPIDAVALMTAILVGGYSGGIVSGIMLGIPGTPSSITTVYDGYPMAKKGEPGRALGIGMVASFFGSIIGSIILVFFGPLIAKYSMNFRPWEITGLIVFALTLVSGLSNRAILKGLLAAAIGLFITTVGYDRNSNIRFDFGFTSLSTGFEMLPVMIGVFAFTQLMTNIEEEDSKKSKSQHVKQYSNFSIPLRTILGDISKQKINTVRSSILGSLIGALPGTGGTVANFISYDQAKKASKKPELFGTGIPDGIVASESSNSASPGGAFIPTLALGIPGDLTMAIMMGIFILHGLQPGPMMFEQNPILVGSIYATLIIGSIIMVISQLIMCRWFAKISSIPQPILVPSVLTLCAVGAYALNNNIFDIWVLVIFGLVGYLLSKADVPLPPLILGVVLGENLENQLFRALELDSSWLTFFTRPLSALFFLLAAASIIFSIMQSRKILRVERR
ncbi:putative tricarboxylic transport membrane protein [Halomonas ventosae]|uniref:Putative tricarboxylic transport membrane protein n=1 Tax=Halomonas ventosae TaxID=229007 RepID=A0A4R6ZWP0_9GAMM|nr:tripartite tricarboxylate transporter permease [Halomonas ventosae]TDR56689.1 putative tricarboxylic transport membrane protein [Halomonas ventosae]